MIYMPNNFSWAYKYPILKMNYSPKVTKRSYRLLKPGTY